jgi:hypothetical protein
MTDADKVESRGEELVCYSVNILGTETEAKYDLFGMYVSKQQATEIIKSLETRVSELEARVKVGEEMQKRGDAEVAVYDPAHDCHDYCSMCAVHLHVHAEAVKGRGEG